MVTIDDLQFSPQAHGGIGAVLKTKSKITISIQAGQGLYSTPRKDGLESESYSAFEVALFNVNLLIVVLIQLRVGFLDQ